MHNLEFHSLVVLSMVLLAGGDHVNWNNPFTNLTMEFSMSCRKNETGHFMTDFSLQKASPKLPKYWRLNLQHSVIEYGGMQTFSLRGLLVAHPPVPVDYQLFHGIGYYKLHQERANGFDEAAATCAAEGGHLAIINSEEESHVLKTLFERHNEAGPWAFIGFHDRLKEGEFVTIFGQPLASTGFYKWYSPAEPNGGTLENCGSLSLTGLLNDAQCKSKFPFVCEYDLSWADI